MKREPPVGIASLTASQADLVDEICDRFEAAWNRGGRPLLEDYLAGVDPSVAPALLLELLAMELEQRRGRGERPSPEEYKERLPDRDELVDLAFGQATAPEGGRTSGGVGGRTAASRPGDPRSSIPPTKAGGGQPRTEVYRDGGGAEAEDATAPSGQRPPSPADAVGAATINLLPDFEVLEEIGRGGMGVVYKARQRNLNRNVALKVLPLAFASDPIRLLRFRNEASIAANLRDARIVPVFDIKEAGGTLVLIMPFVEGHDLAKILADRKKRLRSGDSGSGLRGGAAERDHLASMLPLLDQVIAAVAAIHEAGVVHRDIKPSNILVDERGDIQLTDFGLARLGREAVITSAGAGLGTPGYMSPEQWEGREDVDLRTDVFGLGVTLYEAITLELPYGKGRLGERDPLPEHPSRRRPRVATDLGAVILKALEPDRELRYASAKELQDDWQRARAGLLPRAARRRPLRQISRYLRRHSRLLVSTTILSALLAAAGVTIFGPRPPKHLGDGARAVDVLSNPPGARFVLVRLDDRDGKPDRRRIIRPAAGGTTPARLDKVLPGDYLVVVDWGDGRFHEVNRHVPSREEESGPGIFRHSRWDIRPGGVIMLPEVEAPPESVLDRMAYFDPAGARWGGPTDSGPVLSDQTLPAYYLDQHEVAVRDYRKLMRRLPAGQKSQQPDDYDAVRFISCAQAEDYLERQGKRLPTDDEYLFAATGGGQRPFPGKDPAPYFRLAWPFGPVGLPEFDRTDTTPPVFNLYSNVAEWTSSRMPASRGGVPSLSPDHPGLTRVVRGGPLSVIRGKPAPHEFSTPALDRIALRREGEWPPGVGFRGARSARPRYLDPLPSPPAR